MKSRSPGRGLVWVLTLMALGLVVFIVWYQVTFYDRAYRRLTRRMTKADVIKIFGKPARVEDGNCSQLGWDAKSDVISNTCVEKFEYFSHIMGEWDIGFDSSGRVVASDWLQSP